MENQEEPCKNRRMLENFYVLEKQIHVSNPTEKRILVKYQQSLQEKIFGFVCSKESCNRCLGDSIYIPKETMDKGFDPKLLE